MEDRKSSLAYLAGIIDGEGCITLNCVSAKRAFPRPVLDVTSCDKELTDWLHDTFGGTVRERKPKNPRHSTAYVWRLNQNAMLSLLPEVIPYMRIIRKIEKAQFLVDHWHRYDGRTDKLGKTRMIEEFRLIRTGK